MVVPAAWLVAFATASPAAGADVVLSGSESYPAGFTVPAGQVWELDPEATTTVEVGGSVVVHGTLRMRPGSSSVTHTLRFVDVDESAFSGGSDGTLPISSDVGLWVLGRGILDAQGASKTAWSYDWQPEWSAADDIVAAPHEEGDTTTFAQVDGPGDVPPPNSFGYRAELLNLTRNVKIEGTVAGRAHIFINSTNQSTIRYVELSRLGVRLRDDARTGRYAIHLHRNGDTTRGMVVEGVAAHDLGNHAFVAHASHGVTFEDTIAYDTVESAYWWDPGPENATHDLSYICTVAAKVNTLGAHRGDAYFLGADGNNPTVRDSVAVGVYGGGVDASGFHWPGPGETTWTFSGNVSHNNFGHGSFIWQNENGTHVIEDFLSYHNVKYAIKHGSYRNAYVYDGVTMRGNGSDILSKALGIGPRDGETDTQEWRDLDTGGGVLEIAPHVLDSTTPVRFVRCDLGGVVVVEGRVPGRYDFVACGLEPGDFDLSAANPASRFRVQREDGSAFALHGNGELEMIPSFYSADAMDPGRVALVGRSDCRGVAPGGCLPSGTGPFLMR